MMPNTGKTMPAARTKEGFASPEVIMDKEKTEKRFKGPRSRKRARQREVCEAIVNVKALVRKDPQDNTLYYCRKETSSA